MNRQKERNMSNINIIKLLHTCLFLSQYYTLRIRNKILFEYDTNKSIFLYYVTDSSLHRRNND